MNAAAPPGWHTVTPRIVARDAIGLVSFIRHVFEAQGEYDVAKPTVLEIGDSKLMVSEAGVRIPVGAFLYVYVGELESIYRRAMQ